MMSEVSRYGMTLAEWREMEWWPNGREALVMAGYAGHDREITVNIAGYNSFGERIPDDLVELLRLLLPETWKLENRGGRIEFHPSGRFAGGYNEQDVEAVRLTLPELGLVVADRDLH